MTAPTVADLLRAEFRLTGHRYVYGAELDLNNPENPGTKDPTDCSETTQWATHQIGLFLPDGAMNQLAYLRDHRATMSVHDGLHTAGALLFHGPSDPHVATSLGDAEHTFEARGHAWPVGIFTGASRRPWTAAGWVPGLSHDTRPSTSPPPPPAPGAVPPLRTRTVGFGETGTLVAALQYELVGLTGAVLNGEDAQQRYGKYTQFGVANAAHFLAAVMGYHQFDGHNGIGVTPELFRYIDLFFAKATGRAPIPG